MTGSNSSIEGRAVQVRDRPNCLVVYGPTASGKSRLAADVATAFNGVVINADSMQVYRDLRILTARPSEAEEAAVPHRLYGVLDGAEVCSAARWRDLATAEILAVTAQGKLPILCGGTGLYLKAVMEGLSPMPEVPEPLREKIRLEVASDSPVRSWEKLQQLDPASARWIEPMDRQRIARALEILAYTGETFSAWREKPLDGPSVPHRFICLALAPNRKGLVIRCNDRLKFMVENGGLDEVRALKDRNLPEGLPIQRAVGVPEFSAYLDGLIALPTALEKAQIATRRYAKRQMTWLKGQFIAHKVINEQYSGKIRDDIFSFIGETGLIRV